MEVAVSRVTGGRWVSCIKVKYPNYRNRFHPDSSSLGLEDQDHFIGVENRREWGALVKLHRQRAMLTPPYQIHPNDGVSPQMIALGASLCCLAQFIVWAPMATIQLVYRVGH